MELLSIENSNKIQYYISIYEQQNLTVRQLREKVKTNEYKRLPKETSSKEKQ